MDYHCRAPFRPSVPWCFPGTTEVAAEQLAAGAGQQEGHVDTVVKSCQELEICVFN